MIDISEERDLVKTVFSNPQGEKLLEIWKDVYGDRPSYQPGNTPEDTAYFEGQRAMYLSIINLKEIKV